MPNSSGYRSRPGLDPGAPCPGGLQPLATAVLHGDEAIARMLLKAGARAERAQCCGQHGTALHLAVRTGRHAMVRDLIATRPDLEVRDRDGRTPLALATEVADAQTVAALATAGANVRTHDPQVWPALFIASMAENFRAADVLLATAPTLRTPADTAARSAPT